MSGNEIEIRVTVKAHPRAAAEMRQEANRIGNETARQLGQAGENAGRQFADGFKRDARGRLHDALGRFVAEGDVASQMGRAGERAGEAFRRGVAGKGRGSRNPYVKDGEEAGESFIEGLMRTRKTVGKTLDTLFGSLPLVGDMAAKAMSNVFNAVTGLVASTAATGGLNLLVMGLLALVAAAVAAAAALIALAPVVYLIGGTFGATNTAAVGLTATIATLIIGMDGLGDAWSAYGQKASGGGRSAADAAHQVTSATWALADAQKAALQAQLDIGRAREEETERLEDLSRSLAEARLDESGAVLALRRAEERLRDVRRNGGSALDMAEAQLGYKQALASLDRVRDRVGDLSREQEDANRKGVEGSDAVTAAKDRQVQAQRQLIQATWALAQAQKGAAGGVDKLADAMAKLSPNAKSFMETVFLLREKFAGIKRDVQDSLFEGLDKSVMRLANRSFPTLHGILDSTATSLNKVAKGAMDALGKPEFLKNIENATAGFNRWMDRLGEKTVPKLISAIGKLADKATPFFEEVGDLLSDIVEDFSDWIDDADRTGDLDTFFKDAAANLRTIRDIGGTALGILGEIIDILFPASKRESKSFLEGVADWLHGIKDWLADPENQQKIRDWISGLRDMGDKLGDTVNKVIDLVDTVDKWTTRLDKFVSFFTGLPKRITKAGLGMFDGIKDAFKAALNWVIDHWNNLKFTLPSINMFGAQIGGGTLAVPQIPRMDHGGIAGGLIRIAERTREAVSMPGGGQLLALPQGSMVHPGGATEAMLAGRGGGGTVRVEIDVKGGESEFVRFIRKLVKVFGDGNVQVAFGDSRSS